MSKFCPILKQTITYLMCLDCDDKQCKNNHHPSADDFKSTPNKVELDIANAGIKRNS